MCLHADSSMVQVCCERCAKHRFAGKDCQEVSAPSRHEILRLVMIVETLLIKQETYKPSPVKFVSGGCIAQLGVGW